MIEDMATLVTEAVTEVFSTMLSCSINSSSSTSLPNAGDGNGSAMHVAGGVGFGGDVTGVVYIVVTTNFAREITCRLLGIADSEVESESMVNDAIGELANMVVGQIKSHLCDRGLPCVLTIPSIVRGTNFSLEGCSTDKHEAYRFMCANQQLSVEILMKPPTNGTNH
jgi:chemotaxis protein CheX